MKNIIWLASYPKSGNTWCRTLISNLTVDAEVHINDLKTDSIASKRDMFDALTLINSSDLSYDEIDVIRPQVYNSYAKEAAQTLYIKVHDAYTLNLDQQPIFPQESSRGVVYIVRTPLDVVTSYAAHSNATIDETIAHLGDHDHCMSNKTTGISTGNQFRQKLLTWSEHVLSWTTQMAIPLLLVKYEDLHNQPVDTVIKLAEFCGITHDKASVLRAIELSQFNRLQQQEKEAGFREKPQFMQTGFFRKGIIGSWQEELSSAQANQIIADHHQVMQQLGYLP